jgi:transketolase
MFRLTSLPAWPREGLHGWWRYVGSDGDVIGLERFGASAPGKIVLEKLGFNVDNVVARALALLHRQPSGVGPRRD